MNACYILSLYALVISTMGYGYPYPLQFGIPESKIVRGIPKKDRDFAFIIPRQLETYIYTEEADYYRDYQRSYFAITCAKGGWDCMRHYEILANGCIPYFVDIDKCHPDTMKFLPKELIKQAMALPGVSYLKIDHAKFDRAKYNQILAQLLDHTRRHLTTRAVAAYMMKTLGYSGSGSILYLSNDPYPDYMRCTVLIGLKELYGPRIIDVPKIEHICKNYPLDIKKLYGKGFTYTKIVDDFSVNRDNIEERIKNREFDLIIYGSVHRGLRHLELVRSYYPADKIVYLCGEDNHRCEFSHLHNLFLREFDAYMP